MDKKKNELFQEYKKLAGLFAVLVVALIGFILSLGWLVSELRSTFSETIVEEVSNEVHCAKLIGIDAVAISCWRVEP